MSDSMVGRILWYELLTKDMAAAEKFYKTVVGWTTESFAGAPQPYMMFKRSAEAPVAGMMTIPDGMNFPPHWAMYVGVDNLEKAVAKIEKLGGSALAPVIDVPDVGRMRTMLDPQQAMFAVYQPASPPQQPEAMPQKGDASWHELMTTDAEAAMTFYTDVFAWKPTESMDMGPMGKYHMFGRAFPLGGMMNKPQEMAQVPPNWSIYFMVDGVNAAVDRVKANGGQVLNGPMEVPGGDWVVNCMDPQGAAFSLHGKQA